MPTCSIASLMCLGLLCDLIVTEGNNSTCPDRWISFRDSCYAFVSGNVHVSWFTASWNCVVANARLVAIETREENEFIFNTLKHLHRDSANEVYYWTSGNDLDVKGQWQWGLTASKHVNFTDWDSNMFQPKNSINRTENCLGIISKKDNISWSDFPCDQRFHYVCESGMPGVSVIG